MRKSIILLMIIMGLIIQLNAQVIDSLKNNQPDKQGYVLNENDHVSPFQLGFQDFPGLPLSMGFSLTDFNTKPEMPMLKANPNALQFGKSILLKQSFNVSNNLLGYYRQGKYQLNDKMTIFSSMVLPGKYYGGHNVPLGNYPQLNFGNSLEVGYKFSDKFSIRAGFSVGRYDNGW